MTERESKERLFGLPIWKRDNGRWYADLRKIGGSGRKSLGTTDRTEAENELSKLKDELEEEKETRAAMESGDPLLDDFVQRHLDRMENEETSEKTWDEAERALGYLTTLLKRRLDRKPRVSDVTVARLEDWYVPWRQNSVKNTTIRQELANISAMLGRAERRKVVDRNAVRHMKLPADDSSKPTWLTVGEAARVLQTAEDLVEDSGSRVRPFFHELIATFLLTGGRRSEVFGLTRDDVDLGAGEVRFHPNEWRPRLKTKYSRRSIPLWPQLGEILEPYVEDPGHDSPLLFPAWDGGTITKMRSALETLEDRTEDMNKRLTLTVFRHTYCSARIQTVDAGEPVALFTVAREMGHGSIDRIEDTYGHLQAERVRLPEVRYREADVRDISEAREETA